MQLVIVTKDNPGKTVLTDVATFGIECETLQVVFKDCSKRNYILRHLLYYESNLKAPTILPSKNY